MIYIAGPVATDPLHSQKKEILLSAAGTVELYFPLERGTQTPEQCESQILAATGMLVDLSFERPSTYFELGFARGSSKTVTLIANSKAQIHQTGGGMVKRYPDLKSYAELVLACLSELS